MPRSTASSRSAVSRVNNILYNPGFEVVPGTITAPSNVSGRWIDGTAAGSQAKLALGWGVISVTGTAQAGFDTTTSHTGSASMKLSTLLTTDAMTAGSYRTNGPSAASLFELFKLSPSTSYTLTGYIKTNNVVTNGAFIDCREFSASAANLATTSTNKLSGTNGFTKVTATFTTNASTVFGGIFLRLSVTGNVSDAWFDDLVLFPTTFSRTNAAARSLAV